VHFLEGFIEFLNRTLHLEIRLTRLGGDVRLSPAEKTAPSPVAQHTGKSLPYWIIVAGGKYDFTIKWWHFRRWQTVVDHFRDRILFVQVGEAHHYHPPLRGVLDLRGATSLRELVHWVYHADGVLCPVTLLMHLAAAVEPRPEGPNPRPCVAVAGGRESPHWEAYPTHQFLHTVGSLPCCADGGCWRSRTVALGDSAEHDQPHHLCQHVVQGLPACMDLITADDVIRRVEYYLQGGHARQLTQAQARAARRCTVQD
jgi:ADP-heptose:LPS heptosyltransferase